MSLPRLSGQILPGLLPVLNSAGSGKKSHDERKKRLFRRCTSVALFELLVWPHKVEPWFHSWFRGRVETLDAKYNLIFR